MPLTWRSMLVASNKPITIGNIRSPPTSLRKMICCSLFSLMMIRLSSACNTPVASFRPDAGGFATSD